MKRMSERIDGSDKAVLFDLDGTLLDTVPLIVETYHHIFEQYLGHRGQMDEILASIGTPLETVFEQYDPALGTKMIKAYLDHNVKHLRTHVGVFLKAFDLLQKLEDAGLPMGIVTSKRAYSTNIGLDDFDLRRFFQAIITKESTDRHKPDPEPVLEAMRQLGVSDRSKVLFVGDSTHDLICAKRAGVHSAIVSWTAMPVDALQAQSPDLWLDSSDQLLDYMNQL